MEPDQDQGTEQSGKIERISSLRELDYNKVEPGIIIENIDPKTFHVDLALLLARRKTDSMDPPNFVPTYNSVPRKQLQIPDTNLEESFDTDTKNLKPRPFNGLLRNMRGVIGAVEEDSIQVVIHAEMHSTGRGNIGDIYRVCKAQTYHPPYEKDTDSEEPQVTSEKIKIEPKKYTWVNVSSAPINQDETLIAVHRLIEESQLNARAAQIQNLRNILDGGLPGLGNKS